MKAKAFGNKMTRTNEAILGDLVATVTDKAKVCESHAD